MENRVGDLISREALIDEISREIDFERENNVSITAVCAFKIAIKRAKSLPAVEAVPVVHGRWDVCGNGMTCMICHKGLLVEEGDAEMNYCPNCGAKMDKEELNE